MLDAARLAQTVRSRFEPLEHFERLERALSQSDLELLNGAKRLVPNRYPHPQLPMLQIIQRLVDLLVPIALRDQALELDASLLVHLKYFVDVVGLPARHPGDGDFPGNEVAAADRERAARQTADDRRRTVVRQWILLSMEKQQPSRVDTSIEKLTATIGQKGT